MNFKNANLQKTHDKIAADFKKRTGKDFDESFEEWKASGSKIYQPSEEFKEDFEKFKKRGSNPLREEIEIEALRAIEDRKKKKNKSKSKRSKRCKCK